ncbi:hypothetical protein AMAG_10286 [Allomyces macrogynus ATCC 38327]|uniref:Uncharacterized protein n=1 Tax=Allomyces macrogynus (strain ATCC 38327) TaxID=578462 RepID=A0A0L0SUK8_ALLM3|nr:hypothetical protein AMAG_10286 [Allomyces macrogynus ATCC 38327]|eukprot:KNE66009.1 hypothetical protein AMAG_10286 [Allomyces macrogynus ATCC 38327]
MLMLVRKAAGAGDADEYEIIVQNCKVRLARGEYQQELRSWSARFTLPAATDTTTGFIDVADGRMIEFIVNCTPTTNPQRMLAVLHTYYCSALHPKLHVMAEAIMRKTEDEGIKELYPSLEITRSLHDTLLHSDWSPLGSVMTMLNFFPVTKVSLLTESLNWKDFTHTGIFLFKDRIPFAQFLWAARNACIKHTRHLGLDTVHAEYLFIHSVGHSVDHYCSTKFTEHLRFPIFIEDENTTNWADLVGSACARYNFMAPTLNPLRSNLLKTFPPESVYGKIYRDISAVNQEWADVATASIMY